MDLLITIKASKLKCGDCSLKYIWDDGIETILGYGCLAYKKDGRIPKIVNDERLSFCIEAEQRAKALKEGKE